MRFQSQNIQPLIDGSQLSTFMDMRARGPSLLLKAQDGSIKGQPEVPLINK